MFCRFNWIGGESIIIHWWHVHWPPRTFGYKLTRRTYNQQLLREWNNKTGTKRISVGEEEMDRCSTPIRSLVACPIGNPWLMDNDSKFSRYPDTIPDAAASSYLPRYPLQHCHWTSLPRPISIPLLLLHAKKRVNFMSNACCWGHCLTNLI